MVTCLLRGVLILFSGVFLLRNLQFLFISLRWPAAISPDAVILRFEATQMLAGRFPGTDFVSINLPFTHLVHILGLTIFGSDDTGFRILDLSWLTGTALLLYALLRYGHGRAAAISGVILFSLFPVEATPYGAFQREVILFPLLLAVVFFLQKLEKGEALGNELYFYAGTGALIVCSALIKPPILLFYFLLFVYHTIRIGRKEAFTNLAQRGGAFIAGAIIAPLAICLPLAGYGVLYDYFAGWQKQTAIYLELVELKSAATLASNLFTVWPPRMILALNEGYLDPLDTGHFSLFHLTVLCLWCYLAFQRRLHPAPLFLFVAGVAMYLVQLRGFQYHLYPAWLALMIMLAQICGLLLERASVRSLALACLGAILLLAWQDRGLRTYRGTGLLERERPAGFLLPVALAELARAGNHKSIVTLEHASIALSAVQASRLEFPSPYPVDYVLRKPSVYRSEARIRFTNSLRKRPHLIAISHETALTPAREILEKEWRTILGSDFLPTDYRDFATLRSLLGEHYRLSRVIVERNGDLYTVYEIRPESKQ